MKTNTLIVMLLLFLVFAFSQHEFRPVIDTSAACSWSVKHAADQMPNPVHEYKNKIHGIFYIVEHMPKPKISVNEMAAILENKVGLTANEKKLNGAMYFQSIVNCKGEAGDFQIIHCPENFMNICGQTFDVVKEQLNNWQPGKQRGENADVLVKMKVSINKGDFRIVAPLY